MRRSAFKYAMVIAAALCMAAVSVGAFQRSDKERKLDCDNNWGNDRLVSYCEMREQTLSAGGAISVDGHQNGGVSIKGGDRGDVLLRARVQTAAETHDHARAVAGQIRIQTGGGQIIAEGPSQNRDLHWSVSYEIFVPYRSDLSLKTHNGGIGISDVNGRIEFRALNGGVSLRRLGGNVRGHTTNGGLTVDLDGSYWEGEGLDVSTTNGGVKILIPENYSAHLETGTVNGGMNLGFPITVQGRINKQLSLDLGSGGTTVRAVTTNGGVNLSRK
ncbi:MAG: hypothetical protein L0229_00910 [Blastocatellia bacterium]|nr:hypothetical protein [Blastocatellia bacterium]